MTEPRFVVVDANVAIAVCAREAGKYAVAVAALRRYTVAGCVLCAPNVIVPECLYILCKKLDTGLLTPGAHVNAVADLEAFLGGVRLPSLGDAPLLRRAEEIRGPYGCSHSADGLYLALCEEILATAPTELVTFDAGLKRQASRRARDVNVHLLVPRED